MCHAKKQYDSLAFLFLLKGGDVMLPPIWQSFFDGASPRHLYRVYHHAKYPDLMKSPFLIEGTATRRRTPTRWGHISLVRATIFLIEEALTCDSNVHFILVSESCIPIVDFQTLYLYLKKHTVSHLSSVQGSSQRHRLLANPQFIPLKRFRKQDQWITLTRDAAHFVVQSQHHLHDFAPMFSPDEHYFVNLFVRYGVPFQSRCLTYVDWSQGRAHPRVFDVLRQSFLNRVRGGGYLFLRKVHESTVSPSSWVSPGYMWWLLLLSSSMIPLILGAS